ncbi:hypothetical protein COV23_01820 [Candidatus Wolfebacteria bacterium CG10_big_fil_rev_8_21_14_0_10_31_9]|uniref:Multidrug resistance protein MdtA-like C-terminal permuted SH3 domain-containing protein n=1 Tax=Candidatus Wolfebacteria bacterium CG10_big_fil_rev_8_21_14_0_10_31_9 TaxID=1975070 RepID=A0A2H0RC04_9BACT|nr:MAG: hypothetical protein COV23_01820 [Candidatus Wolfebacteria bacterium CG10_big_fil_rev_8_21_14_0_10_31_9]
MDKFKILYKKHSIIYSIILIIIALLIIYFAFIKKGPVTPNFAVAKYADIVQEVSATGNVKPAKSVGLTFPKSGRISQIYVSVGEKVYAGQTLSTLDSSEIKPQILQAQANLENQQIKLDELKKGTRPEQIAISESELSKAQQDLANYYNGAITVLNDAYAKADDGVRNQADTLFSNPNSDSPQLIISSNDSQAVIDATAQRTLTRDAMKKWFTDLQILKNSPSQSSIDQILINSKNNVAVVRNFLIRVSDVLNSPVGISSTSLATYKTSIATARAEVNLAASSIDSQQQLINSQKITVQKTENQLALQKAGSTPGEISSQEALVKQAQASLENLQAQYENTILRSPINGVITKIIPEVGEISSVVSPSISLNSDANFQIDANIPEVDITKIKLNNPTSITLDAYGNDVIFEAKVISIDPAETIVEGVPTYKTTFQFIKEEDKIKSGMTANITIKTAEKKHVLTIPQRTLQINDANKTVLTLNSDNKTTNEVEVKIGLRGSDGNIEILSGLKEGDRVIIPIL